MIDFEGGFFKSLPSNLIFWKFEVARVGLLGGDDDFLGLHIIKSERTSEFPMFVFYGYIWGALSTTSIC